MTLIYIENFITNAYMYPAGSDSPAQRSNPQTNNAINGSQATEQVSHHSSWVLFLRNDSNTELAHIIMSINNFKIILGDCMTRIEWVVISGRNWILTKWFISVYQSHHVFGNPTLKLSSSASSVALATECTLISAYDTRTQESREAFLIFEQLANWELVGKD